MFLKLSASQQVELARLYNDGKTPVKEIASIFNIDVMSVNNYRKLLKLKNRKSPSWTQKEIDMLKRFYVSHGPDFCSKKTNRGLRAVYHKAERLGLYIPAKKFDIQKFYKIEDAEVAYILGAIWADGSVRKDGSTPTVTFGMVDSDLSEIKDLFFSTGEWTYAQVIKRKYSWKQAATLRASNRELWQFFVDHDYQYKSTFAPTKILSRIPDHLKHYWWRGYFDGDGNLWVGENKIKRGCVSLSSTYEQDWTSHNSLLDDLGVKYRIDRVKDKKTGYKHSAIRIPSNDGITKFMSYIYRGYENEHIGLTRKRSKWDIYSSKIDYATIKTSKYRGVCLVNGNRWKAYYGKHSSRWFKTQKEASLEREKLIKIYGT